MCVSVLPPALQQQSLDRLIHVNNLWACSAYTSKLLQELVADVPTLYQDDPPTQQLMVTEGGRQQQRW